jgi:3-oxoacyl-[acyl-carrier protein] reductase
LPGAGPIARRGTLDDIANAAEYLAIDLAGFVSGQHLLISGGAPV